MNAAKLADLNLHHFPAPHHAGAESAPHFPDQRKAANDVRYGFPGLIDYDPAEVVRYYQRQAAYLF